MTKPPFQLAVVTIVASMNSLRTRRAFAVLKELRQWELMRQRLMVIAPRAGRSEPEPRELGFQRVMQQDLDAKFYQNVSPFSEAFWPRYADQKSGTGWRAHKL